MLTNMHETMMRRLNALDVFYKEGQRAVDKFMKSSLTGIERSKANALYKTRSSQPTPGPSQKRNQQSGRGPSATVTSGWNDNFWSIKPYFTSMQYITNIYLVCKQYRAITIPNHALQRRITPIWSPLRRTIIFIYGKLRAHLQT
jgi:hypothetical protein